ncbi:MAG: protein kinase [Thermoanaerobaculaceae bacterium]|jgi:tetratricopeptide (TPR) repeat protein/tRNA A-37 threonylcarbamoyl transferase component Bud32|nr:protein kinase [Thermoanaerobaculaceae bacterium]
MSDDRVPCTGCGQLLPAGSTRCSACGGPTAAPVETLVVASSVLGVAGAVISGRYRIVRPLGRGGMGEVVEAFDQELGEHVALKFLRPELHADARAGERFRREIKLARKVTHPNVCRVFDVGHAEIDGRHVTFLSMQLLGGETLAQRIDRVGRLSTAEALPLVKQMAAGLAAAHEAGVIHRDFKASNVMLLPGSGGERAVITDFGLARSHGSDASVATQAGDLVGTPAYMAPEQVEGHEITTATDVYALGIVLFEMLTGTRPFDGDTPFECALRRLREPPPLPRSLVPDLDPRWEAVILRCLARDPRDRCDVEEIVPALTDASKVVRRPGARRRLPLWAAAAGVAVAAAGGAVVWRALHRGGGVAVTSARPAVAVLGFVNLSQGADTAWMGNALAETLGSEVAASDHLRQVSGEEVARVRADLGLAEVSTLAPATLARVRNLTGADLVVGGAYLVYPGQAGQRLVSLQVSVQSTARGERAGGFKEEGSEQALFELVGRAGKRLREELSGAAGGVSAATLGASFGGSQEAARLYSEGLARLREFDPQAARDLLEDAARLAPEAPLVHLALADAYASLAQASRASESAGRALALADRLTAEQKRLVEGRVAELARDWPRAIAAYTGLVRDVPDSIEYGLRLGDAQLAAGQSAQALQTTELLHRQLPPPLRDDPRLDILEARAAYYLSDHTRQLEVARRAERKARELGARLVEARALDVAGSAQRMLGDLDGSMESLQKARAMYVAVGSRRNVARVLNSIANVLYERHDLPAAIDAYQQATDEFRAVGDLQNVGLELHNMTWAVLTTGDAARARRLGEESVAILRSLGDTKELTHALHKLGSVLLDQGDLAGARAAIEESIRLAAANGRKGSESAGHGKLADLLLHADELPAAREAYTRAAEILGQLPGLETSAKMLALLPLGVDLEDGRAAEVVKLMAPAVTAIPDDTDPDDLLSVLALLARAQAAAGLPDEAERTLARAAATARRSPNPRCSIRVEIERSFAFRQRGDPARARELAADARRKAEAGGFVPLALEARLEQGLASLAAGDPTARAELEKLGKDARSRGFLLIARKASPAPPAAGSARPTARLSR